MRHGATLQLDRCPHCNIAKPALNRLVNHETKDDRGGGRRYWGSYECSVCGCITMAVAPILTNQDGRSSILNISEIWPSPQTVHESVPDRAKTFLDQAIASIHAPAGAVMLTASAVDSMLKEKGLKEGSLFKRIDEAAATHLITTEMAAWAHEVRLDANDQRHTDESGALPAEADAKKAIDFALALAQFLFVLPARVERGRAKP
uniref:DUF4145 domain-containing protein n=1 Tax=Pseudomonas lundensis TaxID=86185 RepID=UPI0028D8FF33|nr:DUF4145 domain-containing protein [Pseudomonas lundensis]